MVGAGEGSEGKLWPSVKETVQSDGELVEGEVWPSFGETVAHDESWKGKCGFLLSHRGDKYRTERTKTVRSETASIVFSD